MISNDEKRGAGAEDPNRSDESALIGHVRQNVPGITSGRSHEGPAAPARIHLWSAGSPFHKSSGGRAGELRHTPAPPDHFHKVNYG